MADSNNTRSFTDAKGRTWDLSLTLYLCKRVDASDFSAITSKQFSILEPTRELFMEVLQSTPLLFAIAFAIVQDQVANVLGIPDYDPDDPSEEQAARYAKAETEFLKGLDGATIESGRKALWRSLADFFPQHRTVLLSLMDRYLNAHAKLGERMAEMGDELDQLLENQMGMELDKMKEQLRTGTLGSDVGGK